MAWGQIFQAAGHGLALETEADRDHDSRKLGDPYSYITRRDRGRRRSYNKHKSGLRKEPERESEGATLTALDRKQTENNQTLQPSARTIDSTTPTARDGGPVLTGKTKIDRRRKNTGQQTFKSSNGRIVWSCCGIGGNCYISREKGVSGGVKASRNPVTSNPFYPVCGVPSMKTSTRARGLALPWPVKCNANESISGDRTQTIKIPSAAPRVGTLKNAHAKISPISRTGASATIRDQSPTIS